jgi:outer membrane protein
MNNRQSWEGAVGAFSIILLLVIAAGCRNFGTGGTGELVVPPERLRNIEATDLHEVAVPEPMTEIPTTAPATQPAPEVLLTIEEVRQMALQNNLDLRVELIEPTIARTFVSAEEAQFESLLVANTSYSALDTPTASQLSGSQVRRFGASGGIVIPLQTGGRIQLNVPVERLETNNQFATLNPAYTSALSASISHPLLRGAGLQTNSHGIRIAFYDYQISQARTKLQVIRVLAAADRVYWRLYAARQELQVRRAEYDLAVAQLDRARRLVRAGQAAEVEIIRAESGVADRLEGIIIADNQLRDRQRELKRILNEPGLDMIGPTVVIPSTPPNATAYRVDPERAVEAALRQRMEMLEMELRIARENSTVAFARNGMLPLLSLIYTYNINGLGATFGDAFDMVGDKDFEDHIVGFNLELPVGNEAARSRLRRALAARLQVLASKELRTALIKQEMLNAIDQLDANWQRILAAQQRTILAARVLDVETRQFELGLRTSTDVLDAQTRLANSQSSEIAAITEYQIAQVDIAFAAGMLLGASNVSWEPTPAPRF